jgi:hypothetical protein
LIRSINATDPTPQRLPSVVGLAPSHDPNQRPNEIGALCLIPSHRQDPNFGATARPTEKQKEWFLDHDRILRNDNKKRNISPLVVALPPSDSPPRQQQQQEQQHPHTGAMSVLVLRHTERRKKKQTALSTCLFLLAANAAATNENADDDEWISKTRYLRWLWMNKQEKIDDYQGELIAKNAAAANEYRTVQLIERGWVTPLWPPTLPCFWNDARGRLW